MRVIAPRSTFLVGALAATIVGCAPARQPSSQPGSLRTPELPRSELASPEAVVPRETAATALCRIFRDLDVDCDRRVTVDDEKPNACSPAAVTAEATRSRWPYTAHVGSRPVRLDETHQAAQLVQELVLALRGSERAQVRVDVTRAGLDPASYLLGRVEREFWDALTRRIDADPQRLARAASDEKLGVQEARRLELCAEHAARCNSCRPSPASASEPGVTKEAYVYYPSSDPQARSVFANAGVSGRLVVEALPEQPNARWVSELTRTGRHGLLTLALDASGNGRPFVVPGGRFNEMYGWDSFFIAWGLLQNPSRIELARSIADNQAYEVVHYGKILNANRTYYLTRSQPPFLTSLIHDVARTASDTPEQRAWLERTLRAAIREYRTVWNAKPRRLDVCEDDVCLARYFGEGKGEPPEVERGHFDWFYQTHAISHGHCPAPAADDKSRSRFLQCVDRLGAGYREGRVKDQEIDAFFENDRCVRESGHDTTFRWFHEGRERCTDFATVDLNSLLFKYEIDIATLLREKFGGTLAGESADAFCARARARARLVSKHFWDAESGLFYDYDTVRRRRSRYVTATTLYPLWASQPNGCGASLVTPAIANALVPAALRALEAPGGLLAASPASLAAVARPTLLRRSNQGAFEVVTPDRQWEAPNGWAPHQMLAWAALDNAAFRSEARRLRYRWLHMIIANAASYHGTVPEKFDVVARSHAVFQEYGNVNTDFSYIADEGFGWMNASLVVGWRAMDPELKESLKKLVPPEQLFGRAPGEPANGG